MKAIRFQGDTAIALIPSTEDEVESALQRLINRSKAQGTAIAYDLETTGLADDSEVRVITFGDSDTAVVLCVEAHPEFLPLVEAFLSKALANGVVFTAHNSQFDAGFLDRIGVVDGVKLLHSTEDTLTLATLVEQPRKRGAKINGRVDKDMLVQWAERDAGNPLPAKWLGLKTLTDDYLPGSALAADAEDALKVEYTSLGLTDKNYWRDIPIDNEVYLYYAGADVVTTARLHFLLRSMALPMVGQSVIDRERTMNAVAYRIKRRGFLLDVERIDTEKAANATDPEVSRLAQELKAEFGIENPNSSAQIADAIEKEVGARPTKEQPDGSLKDSTAADVLKLMTTSKCAEKVLAYRKVNKGESTYGASWKAKYADEEGFIHPSMNPLGSSTGRITTHQPSMLNVPADKRDYIIAEPGYVFVQADLSAVEVRIGGGEARDEKMHADLAAGEDPYSIVAREAFGENYTKADRNACKPILLGRMYGRSAKSLAYQQHVANPDTDEVVLEREATRIMKAIDKRWRDLQGAAYREAAITKAGRTRVQLDSGRCISLDLVGARDTFNAIVQGTGREILVTAAMRLIEMGYEENLWLCIHDEWILHVPEERAEQARIDLAKAMTMTYKGIPIITEAQILGKKWRKG